MLNVAIVILAAAILVLFAQEFARLFKKIFSLPGAKLLLPLALVTAIIVYYEPWILWFLLVLQSTMIGVIDSLAALFPFVRGANFFASVLVLASLSILPVIGLHEWFKRKRHHPFGHYYLISTVIWLLASMLLAETYIY